MRAIWRWLYEALAHADPDDNQAVNSTTRPPDSMASSLDNRRFNVHSGEKEGTWTSATDAHIQLKLSEPAVGKVRVRVRFSAAGGREGGLRC